MTVHVIGAGPGAADLITVRGLEFIRACPLVLYAGSLVPAELVAEAAPSGEFVFIVSDTGIGIAAEDIPRAMAPFGQVDTRLSRKFEGAGLGLPLAKSLTELHGGEFLLVSRIGVGTTVTVRLPATRIVVE